MLWNNIDVSEPGDQQFGETSVVGDATQEAEGDEQLGEGSTMVQEDAHEQSGKEGSSSKTGVEAAPDTQGNE